MRRRTPVQCCLRIFLSLALLVVAGCPSLPDNSANTVSNAYTDTGDTHLGRLYSSRVTGHPDQSGFILLPDGSDALVARAVLAQTAERSIDAQYFLYRHDLSGAFLFEKLLQAADRGVRVRVLLDDIAVQSDLDLALADSHPNLEVRIFNPFSRNTNRISQFVTRFGSVTRRMHNKSFTVDNQAAILGGRNIGDEYFDADPEVEFGDLDMLAIGPVVGEVSVSFDQYWNSELAYPARMLTGKNPNRKKFRAARRKHDAYAGDERRAAQSAALRDSALAKAIRDGSIEFSWGTAELVWDIPEKVLHDRVHTEYHLAPNLQPYIDSLQSELIIFSPYFVPREWGTKFFSDLSARGIRVRIFTNSLASTDVPIVYAGYAKYRKALLRAGVELYEAKPDLGGRKLLGKRGVLNGSSAASLHAKSFVFDRRQVFIGSLNLDPRSITENTEIGMIVESPEIAAKMSGWFDAKIDKIAYRLELRDENGRERIIWHGLPDGTMQEFDKDPYTSFWLRAGISLLSLLPIESQL